ncbi:MAG: AAA-like domain-containing protein [Chloracidobacterium sp.]|nr:AAA-like domain-containing protein [Chloracidobacterium sp.]
MKHPIYTLEGTVQAGAGIYLSRRADDELLNLCRQGAFACVLTARQMGKSSLMVQTAERLARENIRSVMIDLTLIGAHVTHEQWYMGLLSIIVDQLSLNTDAAAWWKSHSYLGYSQRMARFFEEVLLKKVAEPVIVFVDEINATLDLSFTDDFFASIRYVYNARAIKPEFKRISFTVIGVALPGDLAHEQRTPFNICQRVELDDFSYEEAMPLADGLNLSPGEAKQVLRWAMKWTNGHPYLTQRLCLAMVEARHLRWTEADVGQVVAGAFFGAMSEHDVNLRFVRDMLSRRTPEAEAALRIYGEIRAGNPIRDEEQSIVKSRLKLSGIVRREGAVLRTRNLIYETVFDEQWVKNRLPAAWRKRAGYAVGFVAAISLLSLPTGIYALNQRRKLAEALSKIADAQMEGAAQRKIAEQNATEALAQKKIAENALYEMGIAQTRAEAFAQLARTNASKAERQREIAQSRALAADSISLLSIDPDLGLSLATMAARIARTTEAEDALRSFLPGSQTPNVMRGHSGHVLSAAYSPDGKFIVTSGDDRTARVWNALTAQMVAELEGHSDSVLSAAYSPDGKFIVTASMDHTARIWNASTAQPVAVLKGLSSSVNSAVYSPDGKFILTACDDGVARIWNASTAQIVAGLKAQSSSSITSAAYSPDGKFIVTAGNDHTARIWNASTAQIVAELKGHLESVKSAAYSPDARFIVTASMDRTARIWNASTAQLVAELKGHYGPVNSATYSPDGKFIVTASLDRTALVWNASTAQIVAELKGHSSSVNSAGYSPDGKFIVTTSHDNTARIYPRVMFMSFDELTESARKLSPRELTPDEREKYLGELRTVQEKQRTP